MPQVYCAGKKIFLNTLSFSNPVSSYFFPKPEISDYIITHFTGEQTEVQSFE